VQARGYAVAEGNDDLAGFDIAVVLTDHDIIDLEKVAARVPIVFDTRGAYRRRGLAADHVSTL
jgi:UDP-N-acetyl-D-glucosamine dehydrogenase